MKGNGMGTNWRGLYTTSLLDAHSGWKHRADELSDSLKITMMLGQYFTKHYRGHFYAKAQNLSRKLRAAYDQAFAQVRSAADANPADEGDPDCRRRMRRARSISSARSK